MIAWNTGEACGFTATLSAPSRWANHSEVMIPTIDALDAMCPPTFTANSASRPAGTGAGGLSRLAWSTIRTASQSTRRWISSSVPSSAGSCVVAAIVAMAAP